MYCFCHLDDIIIPRLIGCGEVGQSDLAKVVGDHVVQALPHRIGSAVGQPLAGGSTGHKAAHGGKAALGQQQDLCHGVLVGGAGLRGKGGGYRLTRSPDQYTVSEILMLTEGSLAPVSCLTPGASACARMANCRTYEMWKGLNDLISDYFGKITLADLALPDQAGNDYVI